MKIEFRTLHSKNGGIIVHKNQKAIKVKTELSGDENKFFLNQATGPVVFTGGGKSGWVPGRYFWLVVLLKVFPKLSFNQRHSAVEPVHKC